MVFRPERGGAVHSSVGTLNSLLRNLLQTCRNRSETEMTNQALLMVAGLVFALMVAGLFLTLQSAGKWRDPSQDKDGFN